MRKEGVRGGLRDDAGSPARIGEIDQSQINANHF